MQKSERIEKQTPLSAPTMPPVKRKYDRIEKYNLKSSPRTSDRGKKITSSKSSGSKRCGKRPSLFNVKKKEIKEKSPKQLTVESGEAEPDPHYVGTKKKKMDARSYKALFKPQKIKYSMRDVAEELPRQDVQPQVDSREISSEPMGKSDESSGRVIEKLADESAGTASGVDVLESDIEGKLLQRSPLHTANGELPQPPGGDGLKNLRISCTIIDILDDAERAPKNCSSFENVEVIDGSENDVQCIQPKGIVPLLSSGREVHVLLGACIICLRKKRLDYDSPEDELCSCGATSSVYLNDFSKYKDRGDEEAAIYSESAGRCSSDEHLNEIHSDYRMGGPKNTCVICNQGGELLCCIGNGCKRCYHLSCLDPPLSDVPVGVWHCLWCVKKKVELGAHSVSQGVESIWNAREVEISNAEGVQRQKQYLVKYHGLAHIHNHWVPDKQLLPQNYYLLAEYNSKHEVVRWNAKWTVPHRLLKKRSVIFSRLQNKHQITPSIDSSDCQCEWLVKWRGLGYEHASWELDNSYTLRSPRGQNLMKDYEIRLQKAKRTADKSRKGSYVELSKLPAGGSLPNNYNLLKHVNKLRWFWYNGQNTIVFDNQEWAMTVISFVLSLTEVCLPFLVIVGSDVISQWEAEFTRLAPSIAVTIYSGSRDTRKNIRTLEFYEERGCMMLQVLLSSLEAVFEDLDILKCIRWEAVIVDECRRSGIENPWEQIKILPTDSRILLFNGQIKDTVSEYLNLLSLLDSCDDLDKFRGFKSDTIDNLGKLKERLSCFIAYGSIPELSQFVEYWVPVPMSNCQLEQYCATLLSNSIPLCSCSKSDPVGAFRDILFTVRKCCDHPYLVNSSVQEGLIAGGCLATELLDTGIKACGKLQLLDMILSEIKNQGQQVAILYQTIVGLGGVSIGDILDDFLRQRFGLYSYERIDARVAPSKKHAAVNRFNKKETGQFVFLLENRACSSSIKLSSVNIVIIYDSEWNPANDLRALQKISFNSNLEQIKVFRLYSPCTVEEKALLLAKQVLNLDNNLHNLSRTTSDTLLMWGASYLFSKLDDYHADRSPTSEQLLLNDTTKELLAILSESSENNGSGCIISKVQLGVGRYSINLPLLGEGKFQLKDGEEAHVFWRNLLEGRNQQWKYSCGSTPRNRKRVQYFDESSGNPDNWSDKVGKKRRKVVNENVDPASIQVEPKGHQMTEAAGSKGGAGSSTALSTTQSQSLEESTSFRTDNVNPESHQNLLSGQSSFDLGVHVDKSQQIVTSSNEQKSLHIIIKGEMARLCQIIKVSEDVMHMVERFLEYVIKNHHVSNESPTIIQAFQISLCWIAASILKQKVDKKDSLMRAKQFLNYGCTEEQANHVYSKMRLLKKTFFQCSGNTKESMKDCLLSIEDVSIESCKADVGILQFSAVDLQSVKSDMEISTNKEHSSGLIVSEHKKPLKDKVAECETEDMLKKIQRKCDKRMKILIRKQQEGVQKFHRIWEVNKERLDKEHKLESACIRSIQGKGSVTINKLKLLDSDIAKKMEEYKCLKDMRLKDLEANQLAARNYERQKAACWLAKAKACHSELKAVDEPVGSQSEDKVECSEARAHITLSGAENAVPMSEQRIEDTTPNKDVHLTQGNNVAPSNMCVIAQAEAVGCTVPTETANHLVSKTSEREVGSSSFERTSIAELPSELTHSMYTTLELASVNLPDSGELVSNEIQMVQVSEDIPTVVPETVPEDAGHVHSVEQSDVYNKKCDKGDRIDSIFSDDVNQRDGDESSDGCLSSLELSFLPPAETVAASSDQCGSLPLGQVLLESLISGEFQGGDAPVPENRITLQVEVAISKHIDSETCTPSNDLLPENQSTLQVGVATLERIDSEPSAQTNHAPVNKNHEQLQPVSIDPSLSCDRTPASEVEHENQDRERILIPETYPRLSGEPEELSHQVASQIGQEFEQHPPVALVDSTLDHSHLDSGLVSQVDHMTTGELFASSQSNMSMPQAVVNTAELPNQVVMQSDVDLSHVIGSGNLTSQPPYQVPTWDHAPSLHADPLLDELLRISKERQKAVKVHEDLKKLLKSECEKEIQEVIAQVRNKYEAKLHDAEIAFQLEKNELDKNHNKVLMNRILAEAFRSKCVDLRPSVSSGLQQAMSPSFMQQLSMSRPVRHPVSSVCQPQTTIPTVQASQQLPLPDSSQPRTTIPTVQASQQLPLPDSTVPAPIFVSSSCQPRTMAPAVQTVHHASALFSGAPTRPPHISAITPTMGNLRVGEVRSRAPHLQPFRPSTFASAASLPSRGTPSQQAATTLPATSPSFSQHVPQRTPHSQVTSLPQQLPLPPTNPGPRIRPQPESRPPAPRNSSQTAVQLLMDMDRRPPVHGRNTLVSFRDVLTSFGSLELSCLETLGTTDVLCLSDDD